MIFVLNEHKTTTYYELRKRKSTKIDDNLKLTNVNEQQQRAVAATQDICHQKE